MIRKFQKARFRRNGFTILELLFYVSISALVMGGVVAIQYLTARTIQEMYGPTRARSERMNAMNQIRFRLCDASIGSCTVSDSNHRIQFQDPNLASGNTPITSEFFFNEQERTLYYDLDVDHSDPVVVAKGPINITFTLGSKDLDVPDHQQYLGIDAVVTIYVKTSKKLSYSDVDERDGETVIFLRNT